MKITRFILSALFGCCLVLSAVACSDLSGDNSDFNFGDMPSDWHTDETTCIIKAASRIVIIECCRR